MDTGFLKYTICGHRLFKVYHSLTQLFSPEVGTSARIRIPLIRYSDSYRTKKNLSECRTIDRTSNIRQATLNFRYSGIYRTDQNLSDKKWTILTIFVSFFTNFCLSEEFFRKFFQKVMRCWRPYCFWLLY